MKAKWGMMVVDGRGKIGGHVASKNRGGSYFRTKVTPSNPQTGAQLTARARFTTNSQAWRGLTQGQRDAWNAAVTNFLSTDIFGDSITPSGFNLYVQLNNNLLNAGIAAISNPPLPEAVDGITTLSLVADTTGGGLDLTFSPAITANTTVLLFATAPLSAGKNFVKSEFRQIATLDSTDTSPHDAFAEYVAKFGALPAIGTKVFVKLVPINETSGQAGTAIQASSIAS